MGKKKGNTVHMNVVFSRVTGRSGENEHACGVNGG